MGCLREDGGRSGARGPGGVIWNVTGGGVGDGSLLEGETTGAEGEGTTMGGDNGRLLERELGELCIRVGELGAGEAGKDLRGWRVSECRLDGEVAGFGMPRAGVPVWDLAGLAEREEEGGVRRTVVRRRSELGVRWWPAGGRRGGRCVWSISGPCVALIWLGRMKTP